MSELVTSAGGVWGSVAGVSVWILLAAVGLHLGKIVAEARSWHGIVTHAECAEAVRFRTSCAAFVGAIGANVVLPARFGEAIRIALLRREAPKAAVLTVGATIVLETALEVAFGVIVIVAAACAGSAAGAGRPSLPLAGFLGSHPLGAAAAATTVVALLVAAVLFRDRLRAAIASMVAGFAVMRSPRAFLQQVMWWKLVAWTFRFAAVYVFLLAFHVPATAWTALAVVAAQNVAASIPLLPGNAGTQQAAIAVALAGTAAAPSLIGFGVGMQAASAIADILIGVIAVVLLLGGRGAARLLRDLGRSRPTAAAEAEA